MEKTFGMITIKNLYKEYSQEKGTVKALQDVSLHVGAGEIFGVVGPSGAGKSTLIRCVNLLERPTSGSISIHGQELTRLNPTELRQTRRQIGMIFQHFNLLSSRTVSGNIELPLEVTGMERKERQKRVAHLLELVGLSEKAEAYPSQLSGGQKQRVGIARALACEPRVLLSDEATSALDPSTTASILALLSELNQRLGLTILLITHEMDVVKQVCDHVAILENGRVAEEGDVSLFAADPASRLSRAIFKTDELEPISPDAAGVSITFVGKAASQPVLSDLVRKFNVEVNILGGSIQCIGGKRIGRLQVEIKGAQTAQALASLRGLGLNVEVR